MTSILKILIIFIIFGVLGFVAEGTLFNKPCLDLLGSRFNSNLQIPFCPVHGFGGIIIYLTTVNLPQLNDVSLTLLLTLFITTLECFSGKISNWFHYGKHTWKYQGGTACDGYISLEVSLIWFILIFMFLKLFRTYL